MSALDEVLEAYRDMFGVKTDRANEIHRLACVEVAELRSRPTPRALDACQCAEFQGVHFNNDGYVVCSHCGGKRQ